ncbi:MAG TPA: type IV secretion system protein [Caulobacterales bacterium]|nr:type IV secretion system protein [Caulobacterales bacterium]
MAMCPAQPDAGLIGGLMNTVDCHIRVLAHDSYRELVGPGTTFAAVFTGLLTLYIALVGYQLILGRGGLRVLDLPVAALKIGLIMAFVTSWAAYQEVVFNLLFDGPREITQALLSPMAQAGGGFNGDLYIGLEQAYADLSGAAGVYGAQASPNANILQGGPMLGSGLLWLSALVMLLSTIGVILAAKIVLAFLLAVGPIFIGLCLFDTTRGLFDGWLRTTIAFALAPLAANVFGAAMLMMLAPFLDTLLEKAMANEFDMGPIVTIGLIVSVFTIVMGLAFRVGAGIAGGLSTTPNRRARAPQEPVSAFFEPAAPRISARAEETAARAALIDGANTAWSDSSASRRTGAVADAVTVEQTLVVDRLGQSERRPPQPARRRGDAI